MKHNLENINPAKGNEQPPPPAAVVKKEEPVKTKVAFSIYRDPTDTKYVLVEVAYNPDDSNVKVLTRDVREDVIDKFKMSVAETLFGDL